MAERIDLTVPQQGVPAVPATPTYEVIGLEMFRCKEWIDGAKVGVPDKSYVRAIFFGENGHTLSLQYGGSASGSTVIADAHGDIAALNKANLTANTLFKRTMNRFMTLFPAVLAGSISGVAD